MRSREPAQEETRQRALAARRRRQRAARKYRPDRVALLLIAEAPPSALDRYFYFEDVREQDSLFRYVARAILKAEPTRDNKPDLLQRLCEHGVLLIDLKPDPVDRTPLADHVPGLVRRVKRIAPSKIILVKASVYDASFAALSESGLPVVDQRVPFPGSGQQRRFEVAFTAALKEAKL